MNKLIKRIIIGLMLIAGISTGPFEMTASAAQVREPEPRLFVEGYEVTNESITPGTEFTLTIKIKNFSTQATAEDVVVTVTNPEGIVPEYGTVSMAHLDKIEPDISTEVKLKYTANADIRNSALNFNVTVSDNYNATGAQLRIPVGRLTDFEVEKATIPEAATVNKTSYASVMVENMADDTCYNVCMVARCDGKDIASAQIGSISAGKTRTQSLGLVFYAPGSYAVDILLTYVNAEGENKEYLISSNEIEVTEYVSTENTESEQQDEQVNENNEEDSSKSIIIICISGILLIAVCCLVLMYLYRRK